MLVGSCWITSSRATPAGARAAAAEIAEIGERFGDPDLVALGMMEQGHALVRLGRAEDGVRLIDETMVAVTSGELSPIVAGIVYCNTIAFCRGVYQLRRVREWTAALTRWCARQPDMVAHKGLCLVHRAEIMTLGAPGRTRSRSCVGSANSSRRGPEPAGRAATPPTARARCAVSGASSRSRRRPIARRVGLGREPQPGLALMRLAQGKLDVGGCDDPQGGGRVVSRAAAGGAAAGVRRDHAGGGDVDAAAGACRELDEIAAQQGSEAIDAMSWHARGASRWPRGTHGRPGRAASRLEGVAAARGAVRRGTQPRLGRAGLPCAGRRGLGGT